MEQIKSTIYPEVADFEKAMDIKFVSLDVWLEALGYTATVPHSAGERRLVPTGLAPEWELV